MKLRTKKSENKSRLFSRAHDICASLYKDSGLSYRDFFGTALKMAHEEIREAKLDRDLGATLTTLSTGEVARIVTNVAGICGVSQYACTARKIVFLAA